jgi:two-component system, chemotaxis family, CheB/CheR fusion protein
MAAPCRVLVVDDNRDAADSQAMLLRLDGHDVRAAYDPDEALRIAPAFDPEVALIDLALPKRDGYELCAELRKISPACRMVAVSGYGDQAHIEKSRQAGFRHHLLKPVNPRQLAAVVDDECDEVSACG